MPDFDGVDNRRYAVELFCVINANVRNLPQSVRLNPPPLKEAAYGDNTVCSDDTGRPTFDPNPFLYCKTSHALFIDTTPRSLKIGYDVIGQAGFWLAGRTAYALYLLGVRYPDQQKYSAAQLSCAYVDIDEGLAKAGVIRGGWIVLHDGDPVIEEELKGKHCADV